VPGNAGRGFAGRGTRGEGACRPDRRGDAGYRPAHRRDADRRPERSVNAISVISGTIRAFDQLSEGIADAVTQRTAAAREIASSANSGLQRALVKSTPRSARSRASFRRPSSRRASLPELPLTSPIRAAAFAIRSAHSRKICAPCRRSSTAQESSPDNALIHHHAADTLAGVHQVEALVDVGKRPACA